MQIRRRQRRPSNAGFSLIDVMMGSLVLVVGMMGMIQTVVICAELQSTARRQTLANQILLHEMEMLRLKTWSEMQAPLGSFAATAYSDAQFNEAIAATKVTYQLARTVTLVTTDLYEVKLTITWTKSGTTAAAGAPSGSWLDRLSFDRPTPISRTYTRSAVTFVGKNSLNNSFQRS
jgi:Tfp pilus assembly protein PilV